MRKEITLGPVAVNLPENSMAVLDGGVVAFHCLPEPFPADSTEEDAPDAARLFADLVLECSHPLADMAAYVGGGGVSVARNNVWEE